MRPDLAGTDGVELTEYLEKLGILGVATEPMEMEDGTEVVLVQCDGDADLDAAIDGFVPTAARGEYVTPVPDNVKQAVAFLKTRADAGDNSAKASLVLFRWMNERLNSV